MKGIPVFLIGLIIIYFTSLVASETYDKLLPFPQREIEHLLILWLLQSGFEVDRQEKDGVEVYIKGIKGKETLAFFLRPKSPLATSIQVRPDDPDHKILAAFETFLETHLRETPKTLNETPEKIPPKVQEQMEALVCLSVTNGKEAIQFTGFAVNRKGLILSTAHDPKGIQEVSVTLPDGPVQRGLIQKIDLRRDLVLIDLRLKLNATIPLSPPRKRLQNGERVFAIACPDHL